MATIKVKDENEFEEMGKEMFRILANLRFHTKFWQEHYGSLAKTRKELWEERADAFLRKHGVVEVDRMERISFIRNPETNSDLKP